MQFHPTQEQVAKAKNRFRVVCAGRQWGKTELSVWEMLAKAYSKKDQRVGYFAPTFQQAREIAWRKLVEACTPLLAKPPNEQRLEITIRTQDGGTSEIILKSWLAVEAVRGTQFDFLVLDEVSKMRNFNEGWQAVLLATLLFRRGSVLFISTPYGKNHFYDLFNKDSHEWRSFKFTSYENPFVKAEDIDDIKKTTTEDYFSQEYLGNFVRFTGLVYKEFDITRHVQDFDINPTKGSYWLLGLDFAVRGYTASVIGYAQPDGKIYIVDEYKVKDKPAQDHITAINKWDSIYTPLRETAIYSDPAGFKKDQQGDSMVWSLADEYMEAGLPLVKANNEVRAGINFVRQKFLKNQLIIHPRCEELIAELQQYQWKETPEGKELNEPEEVKKFNDHLVDAMRYMLYSKPLPSPIEEYTPYKLPEVFKPQPQPEEQINAIEFDSLL